VEGEDDEDNLTHKQVKRKRVEEAERVAEERSKRKWERNYCSEDSKVTEEQSTIYYCAHCGAFALTLIDKRISDLPMRPTDGSSVLNEATDTYSKTMSRGPVKVLQRANGLETQYRMNCKDCSIFLCYRPTPWNTSAKYTYIIKDALVDDQIKVKKLKDQERAKEKKEKQENEDTEIMRIGSRTVIAPPPPNYVETWKQSSKYKCMQVDIGRDVHDHIRLFVIINPDQGQAKITGIGEAVSVDLNAPLAEGRANNKLVNFFAKLLGMDKWADLLDKRQVHVVQGQRSQSKVIQIEGFTPEAVMSKLDQQLSR